MPLYPYVCDAHGEVELLRKAGGRDNPAPCPSCGDEMPRTQHTTHVVRAYDPRLDGTQNSRYAPEVIEQSGGRVVKQANGNYRHGLTHNTYSPKLKRNVNVAVVATMPGGRRRLNDEFGNQWLHEAATAPEPLREGIDRSALKGKVFGSDYGDTPIAAD